MRLVWKEGPKKWEGIGKQRDGMGDSPFRTWSVGERGEVSEQC